MSSNRMPPHLKALHESAKMNYELDKPSKKRISLISLIKQARDDEYKYELNQYAISLGHLPPNKMSYEINNNESQSMLTHTKSL